MNNKDCGIFGLKLKRRDSILITQLLKNLVIKLNSKCSLPKYKQSKPIGFT
jgi:hypothetical protein